MPITCSFWFLLSHCFKPSPWACMLPCWQTCSFRYWWLLLQKYDRPSSWAVRCNIFMLLAWTFQHTVSFSGMCPQLGIARKNAPSYLFEWWEDKDWCTYFRVPNTGYWMSLGFKIALFPLLDTDETFFLDYTTSFILLRQESLRRFSALDHSIKGITCAPKSCRKGLCKFINWLLLWAFGFIQGNTIDYQLTNEHSFHTVSNRFEPGVANQITQAKTLRSWKQLRKLRPV